MGRVYEQVFAQKIEVRLDTGFEEYLVEDGRVMGVWGNRLGKRSAICARRGVVVCAGGFEWNQQLRDRYFTLPSHVSHSSTPQHANRGDALVAGLRIGAATEHVETGWWIPTMTIPMPGASNYEQTHQAAFDGGRPHSVCVNRNSGLFVDEACGYDPFGKSMVEDHLRKGPMRPAGSFSIRVSGRSSPSAVCCRRS